MGKKKSKVPEQPTTKTDMGLFGTATTGPKGSKFDPTQFQKDFTGMTEQGVLNAQNALNNREIDEEVVDNYNRQFQTDFQNQLLAPAMQKNWLRGSSANDVASIANQNYNNNRYNLINDEMARQQQLLANALAGYTTMYDIAKGTTGLSNALNAANSNYALQAAQLRNQSNSGLGSLLGGLGSMAGGIGGMMGGFGKMNSSPTQTPTGTP